MTTVAAIRTTYLNGLLRRTDGASTVPWNDTQASQHITDALTQLWQDGIGKRAQGTVATSEASDVYTIPAALTGGRISRIEVEQTSGGQTAKVDRISSWRYYSDTQVRIVPILATDASLVLRFFGWIPFQVDASDLPTRLENVVAMKAAALAYGALTGYLVNAQNQVGLDSSRVVDYQSAVGLSAYWERRYQAAITHDPNFVSYAPRRSSR